MSKEIQFKEEKKKVMGGHLKRDVGRAQRQNRDKGIRPELLFNLAEEFVTLYKQNTYKATFCKYKLGTEPKLSN